MRCAWWFMPTGHAAKSKVRRAASGVNVGKSKDNFGKPSNWGTHVFSHYMAFGRVWESATYSHGVWESFATHFREVISCCVSVYLYVNLFLSWIELTMWFVLFAPIIEVLVFGGMYR